MTTSHKEVWFWLTIYQDQSGQLRGGQVYSLRETAENVAQQRSFKQNLKWQAVRVNVPYDDAAWNHASERRINLNDG